MTLNCIAAVGMLGVGVIGTQLLGSFQDKTIDSELAKANKAVHEKVEAPKQGIFGEYAAVDMEKVKELQPAEQELVKEIQDGSKKITLKKVVVFPILMFVCYILLIGFFKTRGGYRPVDLSAGSSH